MNEPETSNRRILVVDDNPAIHEDFRKLLVQTDSLGSMIDDDAANLFGERHEATSPVTFELDSAFQGEEALAKVRQAIAKGTPHAMAFIDMRMPPGWDGVETIRRIWQVHPELEVVICTAYSDRSWSEIQEILGVSDHLLILKKPFDKVEVYQLALALTEKWNLHRLTRCHTENLEELVRVRTQELNAEHQNLRLIKVIAEVANRATNPAQAIRNALEEVCAHTGWSMGHAYLISKSDSGEVASTKIWHLDPQLDAGEFCRISEQRRIARGLGLRGRVLSRAEAVWMADIGDEPEFQRAHQALGIGLKSAMAFPVLIGSSVAGVLEFFARHVQPRDERVLDIMNQVGAQLGRVVERQWAHEDLRQSEAYFRSLTDNALDFVTLLQQDGTIRYESRSAHGLLGYSSEEFRGKDFYHFVHPEDIAPLTRAFRQANKNGGATPQLSFRLRHKDQTYRLMEGMGKNMLEDPVVGGIILNARDVTERKRLEERFLQAQKVQAIGQLAGGVAHDFNNILTAIIGYADLLLRQLPQKGGSHLNAQEIKKSAGRAASLTRQLLAFSRRQVLQPRVLDLNGVVADMDKMLRRLLGDHIDLVTIAQPDLGRVKADPGQIEQVILNLAVNAGDAMPTQGNLTIETSNVILDGAYCRQRADVQPGEYVMLAITDNGCGIAPEIRGRLFEPFFTTKQVGKGTGLGLATCHGIVKQSGGNIAVYSEVGQGTSFKVYLPRVYEALDSYTKFEQTTEMKQGTETVLFVEDDSVLRELGLLVLGGLGYRVLPAENGVQALRVLEQHKEQEIHLLVTDVVMPEMGGKELSENMRAISPKTKVLFCSGYTEDAIMRDGLLEEGIAFLQKPYTIGTFADKVRATLDLAA